MGHLTPHKQGIAASFAYDPLLLARFKDSVPGRRWLKGEGVWVVPWPSAPQALAFAEKHGWTVDDGVHGRLARLTLDEDEAVERAHAMMESVGLDLYSYQPRGVRFLARHQVALLGWEMRTGKTIVSLGAHPEGAPMLVTAPASAVYQWAGEVEEKRPDLSVVVPKNRAAWRWPEPGECVIGSWASLPKGNITEAGWILPLPGCPANLTYIPDEVQYAKNPSAARTQNARSIIRAVVAAPGRVWAPTGTPIQNHPLELWHLLCTLGLEKTVFGSWPEFLECYGAERVFGVLEFHNPDATVPKRLRRVMDRLTFAEAAPHIKRQPPRFLPVDVTASARKRKVWEESYETFREAIENSDVAPLDFQDARKELAECKAQSLPQIIEDIEAQGGGPILVFCWHRKPIEDLSSRKGWGTILGGVSKKEREKTRRAFQNGELRGLGLTIGAGSVALTLSAAKTVVFVDLDWNPTTNHQAMFRALDVAGGEAPATFILTARGTVDERLMDVLYRKTKMIEGTLADRQPPPKRSAIRRRR